MVACMLIVFFMWNAPLTFNWLLFINMWKHSHS
jgi:hypothetical protein